MQIRSTRRSLELEAFGLSDPGHVRVENEDAFALSRDGGLFVVADGVGGAAGGEVASRVATEVVPEAIGRRIGSLRKNAARRIVEDAVRDALQDVNDAMVKRGKAHTGAAGMSTTVVLALVWRGAMLIAHLGDSRAYLWHEHRLTRLTEDHALAAQLVRWGKITESKAEENPGKSMLLRCLGTEEELEPDFTWVKPQVSSRLLLCTDGLTNMVSDEEILQIMDSHDAVESNCRALVACANQAGGKDNITVVVIRFPELKQRADSAKRQKEAGL